MEYRRRRRSAWLPRDETAAPSNREMSRRGRSDALLRARVRYQVACYLLSAPDIIRRASCRQNPSAPSISLRSDPAMASSDKPCSKANVSAGIRSQKGAAPDGRGNSSPNVRDTLSLKRAVSAATFGELFPRPSGAAPFWELMPALTFALLQGLSL